MDAIKLLILLCNAAEAIAELVLFLMKHWPIFF